MNKEEYKTLEELKEELGDKFEEYMYKANIELLTKRDKTIEYIETTNFWGLYDDTPMIDVKYGEDLLKILKGDSNE